MRLVRLFLRRLLALIPVLLGVSLATFFLIDLVPGDPAAIVLGTNATPEQLEVVRNELNLDQPAPQRYVEWLTGALSGQFGRSYVPPEQSVADALMSRLPVTLELALVAMLIATLVSIPLVLLAARREGESTDSFVNFVVIVTVSVPAFLVGLFLIFGFVLHKEGTRDAVLAFGVVLAASLFALATIGRARAKSHPEQLRRARKLVISGGLVLVGSLVLWRFWPNLPRQGF